MCNQVTHGFKIFFQNVINKNKKLGCACVNKKTMKFLYGAQNVFVEVSAQIVPSTFTKNTDQFDKLGKPKCKWFDRKTQKLNIGKDVNFNECFEDVCFGVPKTLKVHIRRGLVFHLPETRNKDLTIDCQSNKRLIQDSVAVLVHCFDISAWTHLRGYIELIVQTFDTTCVVVTTTVENKPKITKSLNALRLPFAKVLACENRGMDIGGFFVAYECLYEHQSNGWWPQTNLAYKLHSKRTLELRSRMTDPICGTSEAMFKSYKTMENDSRIAMVGYTTMKRPDQLEKSQVHLQDLCRLARWMYTTDYVFVCGTIFFVRTEFLRHFFHRVGPPRILLRLLNTPQTIDMNWRSSFDYSGTLRYHNREQCVLDNHQDANMMSAVDLQPHERDGMIEHAFERLFGLAIKHLGYKIVAASN